ncbi:MAG: hypothetical protein JWO35_463 [Candidatus Saccharibacteria bacterium]|nr:hypothetical protein [Candidatus Saccharibacteria bacterium]
MKIKKRDKSVGGKGTTTDDGAPSVRRNMPYLKLFAVPVVLIMVVLLGWTTFGNKTDCTKLYKHGDKLLQQQKYKEAYNFLKPESNIEACRITAKTKTIDAKQSELSNNLIAKILYSRDLAVSGYMSNIGHLSQDNKNAKQYAKDLIAFNGGMTSKQLHQIPGAEKLMIDTISVQLGFYTPSLQGGTEL